MIRLAVMRRAFWPLSLLLAIVPHGTAFQAQADEPSAGAAMLKQGNATVVLVGDSITGQSRNHPAGYAHQIDWALKAAYPDCQPRVIALGGSGQGVGSWLGVEKRSRGEDVFLDVKGINVKTTLDAGADVLIVMLGMNDVLAPYVADEPAALDSWEASYRTLVASLAARLHPGTVALATVTMDTEDPDSPKNRMIGQLNARIRKTAAILCYRLAPTNEAAWDVLRQGRRLRPDFHVANDFVHPNEAGHLAIAIAMLRALGEQAAAERLAKDRLAAVLRRAGGDGPALSYELTPIAGPLDTDRQSFHVRYWWTGKDRSTGNDPAAEPPRVTLSGPDWEATPASAEGSAGEFVVTGVPEQRQNLLTLQGTAGDQTATREVKISPPWLVATGLVQPFWTQLKFDPAKARTPVDEAIEKGAEFTASNFTVPNSKGPIEAGPGQKLVWRRYQPSVNFTGLDAPGSVDFAAIAHARNFETGYSARWVYSPRERPVRLTLGTQAFAGELYLTVHLNGQQQYRGQLTAEPKKRKEVDARLRQGWNVLACKANHCNWQWQYAVDLVPTGDDSLDDLRYSTVPH